MFYNGQADFRLATPFVKHCVTARTKLCYYSVHAIVQREITAYQLVSLLRTASHLIAVTWHLPRSASSYIERDRMREKEREGEMLKLLLSTRHTLRKEYILQRINSRNRLAMTRFFHEVADRPEARHRSIFCSANDDRGFINVTKKRRDIKRAIRNQLYGYALVLLCFSAGNGNRECHSRRSSVAVT